MGSGQTGRRQGPGYPFGPESVLPATGSSSVVYWVPGPRWVQPPRSARAAAAFWPRCAGHRIDSPVAPRSQGR
jgi:hypothetical protein